MKERVADRSRSRRRRKWFVEIQRHTNGLEEKVQQRKLGRGANQLMTAERASRSDVLRAAGDVTAERQHGRAREFAGKMDTTLIVYQQRAADTAYFLFATSSLTSVIKICSSVSTVT